MEKRRNPGVEGSNPFGAISNYILLHISYFSVQVGSEFTYGKVYIKRNLRKVMENEKPLYAVYMKRSGKEKFMTEEHPTSFSKRNLIFCSSNKEQLTGYINVFHIPFDTEKTDYSLIDIQPLINKKIISRKNLADITESWALSNLEIMREPLSPPKRYNGAFDGFN